MDDHDIEMLEMIVILLSQMNDLESSSSSSDSSFSSLYGSSDEDSDQGGRRRKLIRIKDYCPFVIDQYDAIQFKEHFRLSRTAVQAVIGNVRRSGILPDHSFGRTKVSADKAVYLTLWYLGNNETFRQCSDRFDVALSTCHKTVNRVVSYLTSVAHVYIKWPSGPHLEQVKAGFMRFQGFEGVIGAVDGSHIRIKKPALEHANAFVNRKGYPSLLVQAVCDHQKRFTSFFCGEPGSIHDSRLLRMSQLYRKGIAGDFGNDYLLGDSGYPCLRWLVTPFRDNGGLTVDQHNFNHKLSSTRIIIENAFGLLKGKFRRLNGFNNDDLRFVVRCIMAAAVLHNICLDVDGDDGDKHKKRPDAEDEEVSESRGREHFSRRDELFRQMFPNN